MDTFDRQLRYFIKIAEVKSLSRAADALDCTQPALSRQLAALETHLGCALFNRTGRGMDLTDAGRRVLEQVRPAFATVDATVGSLRDLNEIQPSLRIAAVHTLNQHFLGDLVKAFGIRCKSVSLSLMGRSSPEIVDLVVQGKADVGLVYDTAVASERVMSTPLFDDVMCLVTPRDTDLCESVNLFESRPRLIGFPAHFALRRMLDSSGLGPCIVAESDTVDVMLQMVVARIGACILPERFPDDVLAHAGLRKVAIAAPTMTRRVVAIERIDRTASPGIRQLVAAALDVVRSQQMRLVA